MMTTRFGRLLGIASLFAAGAAVFYVLGRRTVSAPLRDIVEETSLESFPASDPPSWTSAALL